MEEQKALLINNSGNLTIKKINSLIETSNKLLKKDYKELLNWWDEMDIIWKVYFINEILPDKKNNLDYSYLVDESTRLSKYNSTIENEIKFKDIIDHIKLNYKKLKKPKLIDLLRIVNLEEVSLDTRISEKYWSKMLNFISFRSLEKLKKLKILRVHIPIEVDWNSMNILVDLVEVEIFNNKLINLTPLIGFKNLKKLELYNNTFTNLNSISELYSLESLSICNQNIADLKPLSNLIKLNYLELRENRITDITPLSMLVNLKHLDLDHNEISDAEVIKNFTKLYRLKLRGNKPLKGIENFIYFFADTFGFRYFSFDRKVYLKKYNHGSIDRKFKYTLYLLDDFGLDHP